jgi:hypothetical protein
VACEPVAALLPDQAPEAVQDVAFVALHVNMEVAPLAMLLGAAPRVTVGAADFTETVVD